MNTATTTITQTPDYIPLAMLNALAYCPRRFAYEFIQGEMLYNEHVVEGSLRHQGVDLGGTAWVGEAVQEDVAALLEGVELVPQAQDVALVVVAVELARALQRLLDAGEVGDLRALMPLPQRFGVQLGQLLGRQPVRLAAGLEGCLMHRQGCLASARSPAARAGAGRRSPASHRSASADTRWSFPCRARARLRR